MANEEHLALLKQGVNVWNEWREKNPKIRPDLRGADLKREDFSGADFSKANIQGADFSNAILQRTNFTGTKAGLQRRWLIAQLIISLGLATVAAILSGFTGVFSGFMLNPEMVEQSTYLPGTLVLLALIVLLITVTIQGLTFHSFGTLALGIATVVLLAVALGIFNFNGAFGSAFAFAFAIAVAVASAFTGAVASSVVGTITTVGAIAVVTTFTFAVAVPFAIVLAHSVAIPVAVVFISTATVLLLGSYIAWKALQGDNKFILIRTISIAITTFGGTSFTKADLTDANFTSATLKSTDFRKANLTRTCWREAEMLDRVRPGNTYLQDTKLRHLVTTGDGQNENFERQDLRGLNLRGANLENASFIDADFYRANLQEANLARAKLVRAQFEKANLRGACLTGCCIQDWTISRDTELDGIICEYVYLKWVNGDKRDQMPPRGKFKEGGFIFFIKYILDTIDLYHDRDINPRLALTVLRRISKTYHEPLDIVALGKRGEKVFIKVKISEDVDPERFKEEYFSRYEQGLKLLPANPSQLPLEDELIENKIAEIASAEPTELPSINVTHIEYLKTPKDLVIQGGEVTVGIIETGGDSITGPVGIGKVTGGTVNAKNIGGVINEAKSKSLAETVVEIQQLLKQLQQTYPTSTTAEQELVAAEAVKRIESDPAWKQRVVNAAKEGGLAAFEKAFDNPIGACIVGAIKGWQEAE